MTIRRTSAARSAVWVAALLAAAGCSGGPHPADDVPSVPGSYDLGAVVRANALGSLPVRAVEAHRGPRCSIHVVQVADAIAAHVHEESDETIVIWRGAGVMIVGDEAMDVGAGQVIHIPKGVPHAFRLTSTEPAVGVSMMTPGLRKGDRKPVSK